MVEMRIGEHLRRALDCPPADFGGAEHEMLDSGMHERSRAHGARLDRDVERGAGNTIVTHVGARIANRNQLRMRAGIVLCNASIGSAPNDLAVTDDYRTHRDLTCATSDVGKLECLAHETEVRAHDVTCAESRCSRARVRDARAV